MCQFASAAVSVRILLSDQIAALQQAGYRVRALSGPDDEHGTFGQEPATADGYVHDHGPIRREPSPAHDVYALAWLVRYFRRHRFDIVHTHTPKAGLLGPLAARLAGVPTVVHTVHGFLFHDRMRRLRYTAGWGAEKWTAAFADALLFQSHEDFAKAPHCGIAAAERCFYIGNGVEIDRFRPNPEARRRTRACFGFGADDFVIGYVGRMVREKGVLDLLHACERLGSTKARLLLVGPADGESDALGAEEMRRWQARLPMVFTGFRSDVAALYAAMDLFVLPSYREGMPRALGEACIAGVPAIATDIRGSRELIRAGATGWLYPPGDVHALVECVREAKAQPAAARARAARAQLQALELYDRRRVHERLLNAYREIGARGA